MKMIKVIVIPALEPDEKLIKLIDELEDYPFRNIIVVDDGSSAASQSIFEAAEEKGCEVIHHDCNMGKGAAIKTGITAAMDLYESDLDGHISHVGKASMQSIGIITADADGQHRADDIALIAKAMDEAPDKLILGVRDFSKEGVPARSLLGNRITSLVFKLTTGVSLSDTQTGLRGITPPLLRLALKEEGNRYEYEMNFLQDAAEQSEFVQIPIDTVYEDNNKGSHFRTIRDSARVYGRILKFAGSSLAGAITDYLLFLLLMAWLAVSNGNAGLSSASKILIATAVARICSGALNFILNKYWSFGSGESAGKELARYSVLFVSLMLLSAAGVSLLSYIIPAALAKPIVDITLFFASYNIQKKWVFEVIR